MKWLTSSRIAATVVFVVALALYANTIGHDFVWDDFEFIVENEAISSLDGASIREMFSEDFGHTSARSVGYYRPMVTLSYHFDHRLFGTNAAGFHWTNVLLNAVACVAAFWFVRLLFGSVLYGFVASMMFAAHPIHTESVAWVSGRTDILAALWSLVSLSLYVLARRRKSGRFLALSAVAFSLSVFSKESVVLIPFVMVIMELKPMRACLAPAETAATGNGQQQNVSWLYPALFMVVVALYLLARLEAIGTVTSTYPAVVQGAGPRIAIVFSIVGGYLYKALVPLKLSAEYDAFVPVSMADPRSILGFVVTGMAGFGVWRYRRHPEVILGASIFVLGLIPVLNIVPIGEVSAERFLYLPSLGIAIILGRIFTNALQLRYPSLRKKAVENAGGHERWEALAPTLVAVLGLILAVWSIRTVARNGDWKNGDRLFAKTISQEPSNPRAFASLGAAAERRGDTVGAVRAYRRALELKPDFPVVLSSLAGIQARRGDFRSALELIQQAIAADPGDPELITNLGSIYYETGRFDEAAREFEKALQLDPSEMRAHFNLGLALIAIGDSTTARAHFDRASRGGPDFHMTHYYLAIIDEASGDRASAAVHARTFVARHAVNDEYRRRALLILEGSVD